MNPKTKATKKLTPQANLIRLASHYPFIILSRRQLCDLDLLLNGAFAPLKQFMGRADYESVLHTMRLADNTLFPIPIVLDITKEFAKLAEENKKIALRDGENFTVAVLNVEEIWAPDLHQEAQLVYGTQDESHPGVHYLFKQTHPLYMAGKISRVAGVRYTDYLHERKTPAELKAWLKKKKWKRALFFQTRNPIHKAHNEIIVRAMQEQSANAVIHPVVGMAKPNDIDYHTRVRCYRKSIRHFPAGKAILSLLPLAMRMAGPRECLWHGLIRKNYGCTHFIIGRDHAGPGRNKKGKAFYAPFAAQQLFAKYQDHIGVQAVYFEHIVYSQTRKKYIAGGEIKKGEKTAELSGTNLYDLLESGDPIPEWFTYPEIAAELRKVHPPRKQQGFTVFLTGLPASGKSTLAHGLVNQLLEYGKYNISLLDGDMMRNHLSSELGFSPQHRSINVQRVGYVASEITKNRGIAVCALIAPYQKDRDINRQLISAHGGYIEVYVKTPLAVCEQRDSKGYYMRARQELSKHFTGIDDPYEEPQNPELVVDTSTKTVSSLINRICAKIKEIGYL